MKNSNRFCDGINRRSFLRVGAAGAFGASWSLSQLHQSAAAAAAATDRSLIIIFLQGGLSTIDTFDMKPNAPAEIRGEFDPISTNVPGTQVCHLLPKVSQEMDKFSLLRSMTVGSSDHSKADHHLLTGYRVSAAFKGGNRPNNEHPCMGAVISRKLGPRGSIPAYVTLPDMHKSAGAAYLGPGAAPLTIQADPNDPNFSVRDIVPSLDLDASRLENRAGLLNQVDRYQAAAEVQANRTLRSVDAFRERAFSLMTSPAAKRAFNIHAESDATRDMYGRNTLGQSCLMARRLVEAGVRCVFANHVDWDTHLKNFHSLKVDLLPPLDMAMSALYRDMHERGLLESTIVMVTGEFGRTPRINNEAGRDHWGPAFTVMIGGGGIHGGRIIGSTDEHAAKPADRPLTPEDLAATIHHQLGINGHDEFLTPEGRPIKIVNEGRIISELL